MFSRDDKKRPFSGPPSLSSEPSSAHENVLPGNIVDINMFSQDSATLRLKCNSKESFQIWLCEFQSKTVLYKIAVYPNSHRGRVKAPSKKHTGYPAKLTVTIKSSVERRRVRLKDTLRAEYPTEVRLNHCHNHNLHVAEAVKYKDPSETVRRKFIELFKSQHDPIKALEAHKRDLLEEYEEEYYKIVADCSLCPDIQWVYRLYRTTFNKEFGDLDKGSFLKNLRQSSK